MYVCKESTPLVYFPLLETLKVLIRVELSAEN